MYYDVQKSAERIRKLRESRRLTQNEAAEEMGFSLGGYRKLEQGLNGGSVDSLILVAEFYHVSLDRGTRGTDTKVPELCTPNFEKKIIQWFYKLNRTNTHSDIFSLCLVAEWL